MTARVHLLPVLFGALLIASCPRPNLVPIPEDRETTTVSIRFTGICTLYDPHDKPWTEPHSPLIMLLPNAEEPYAVFGHGHAHRHVPFILFSDDYRHLDQPLKHLFAAVDEDNKKFWRYELRGEEVFLASGTNPQPTTLCYSLAGDPKKQCPSPCDSSSLHWLPRMTHVRGGSTKAISVRAPFVEKPGDPPLGVPHPDPRLIAARFVINAGHLAVDSFMSYETRRETGPPILWDFRQRNGKPRHRQAMAQELVWSFNIEGSILTLQLRPFDARARGYDLTFRARCGRIEIKVGNLLPEDILSSKQHQHQAKSDVHFALYDRFVADVDLWTAVIPFPAPKRDQCEDEVRRSVDGLNCGPNRLP